jgi:hypothetical protein
VTEVPWTRALDPVSVKGDRFPGFDGAPINDLFMYALEGGNWQQVPFQIDEIDASGVYTTGDGLLDANDELVFMARDLGEEAAAGEWLGDADAQAHDRYQVRVANPLNPSEEGWVYLHRSATLSPAFDDYVDWDGGNSRIVASTYVVGYAPASHAGMETLELNGTGVDVLDRTKFRVYVTCYIGGEPLEGSATEEDLVGSWDIAPSVDGSVRVGGGS